MKIELGLHLGQLVHVSGRVVKRGQREEVGNGVSRHTVVKRLHRIHCDVPRTGVFVGVRTLREGYNEYIDDMIVFQPLNTRKVYLIAINKKQIWYCLPEDISSGFIQQQIETEV